MSEVGSVLHAPMVLIASGEKELEKAFLELQIETGKTYQVITIYHAGNKAVMWFMAQHDLNLNSALEAEGL